MRLNKFFLMGAVIAVAMSCSDNHDIDNGGQSEKGTSYSSVSITLKKNGFRGVNDTQVDNAGTDAEQDVKTLRMLSTGGDANWLLATIPGADNTFWKEGTDGYSTAPWATNTSGQHTMALIFNDNGVALGLAENAGTTLYEGHVTKMISPNFTMTSSSFVKDIKPGITKEQAANGTTEAQNVFTEIGMERVVSKGIVKQSTNFNGEIKQAGTLVATVSDLTFAAVNGATKTFLFKNNAGDRTMDVTDPNLYQDFESAIHGIAPIKDAATAYAGGLVRLGVAGIPTEVSTAKAVNASTAAVDDVDTKVFYFLENSGKLSETNMKLLGYYRYAYAKVYATYHPQSVLTEDGTKQNVVAKAGVGTFYIDNGDGTYSLSDASNPNAIEGVLVSKLITGTIAKGVTFYKGAVDGFLYSSVNAAASSVHSPGQLCYTYVDGRAGYRALWNRQIVDDSKPNEIVNADARRNNAYVLSITGFAGLGFPWDESDPNDPNLPKTDPDDPILPDPTDPNIEPTETYMRVEAEVLPWNVVIRDGIVLQ